ncbi:pilus assembly protein [Amycolatopsis echigonensis]|uniref:Pilus assembly protein n=1 Tax=Amycolatopsis echigonensis TaxID=2576905 RepID=A0A8E1VYJ7_9PSEU|nr:pilus assembly protein [Amycolatopsis echigonensis]MCG3751302.1 pilus assembly protein [Amycolatopsis sp. Poz14]
MRSLRDDERGSAAAELVLLTPGLIMMLLFIVFCGRMADATLRLEDAAHQAARAASLARNVTNARNDAHATASAALANAGITCRSLAVTVNTAGFQPGATVSVEVTCTAGLSDLALLGMPGSIQLSASFSSPVDTYRGVAANAGGT